MSWCRSDLSANATELPERKDLDVGGVGTRPDPVVHNMPCNLWFVQVRTCGSVPSGEICGRRFVACEVQPLQHENAETFARGARF